MASQRGSASLLVAAALGFALILAALSADMSRVSVARVTAQTAADAAALAAAQELALPSGRSPSHVAAEYAEKGGARLVLCRCEPGTAEALVSVEREVELAFLGEARRVRVWARAVVAAPPGTAGLQPFFAARLACLFERVPELSIVSGYRTRAEQAALFEEKPDLAAPPGHSNHELGLAVDLGYPSESAEREAHIAAPVCRLEFPVPNEPWHVEPSGLSS